MFFIFSDSSVLQNCFVLFPKYVQNWPRYNLEFCAKWVTFSKKKAFNFFKSKYTF